MSEFTVLSAGLSVADIDVFEINEAFASQVSSRDESLQAGSYSLQTETPASRGQHFACESIYVCV